MHTPTNGNGNSKVTWWIISTLTGLVLGVGGSTIATTNATLRQHAERLATVENQLENNAQRLERIDRNLEQIAQKLR